MAKMIINSRDAKALSRMRDKAKVYRTLSDVTEHAMNDNVFM